MDEKEYNTVYKVVLNHEELYSIWPADRKNPIGWKDVVGRESRGDWFVFIEKVYCQSLERCFFSVQRIYCL